METLVALGIGLLTAAGVYLALRPRSFDVVVGLTLLSYAVNVFIFVMGRLSVDQTPVIREGLSTTVANYADPLPQALVLTAIVISFGMTAVLLVIALRSHADHGSDHVDAAEPDPSPGGTADSAAGEPERRA